MRKHHTIRTSGRVTVRPSRRPVADVLSGAALTGALLISLHAGGAGSTRTTSAAPPARVGGERISLVSAVSATGRIWVASSDGHVTSPNGSPVYGQLSTAPSSPIVAAASTPDGNGYWLVGADGGVFAFGDAAFHGSTGGIRLNAPIVGMAPTPDGRGYWLVARDGGIFTFGDAGFHGSTGGIRLNAPIVGMAATPGGAGYWLVASDGGIFAFGDAGFHGSTGGIRLNAPVVAMAASPSGHGYWLVGSDGGVFAFGDAAFHGSLGGAPPASPLRGMAADPAGGYWLFGAGGAAYPFGPTGARPSVAVAASNVVVTVAAANSPVPSPGARALAFAEAQIGKPYVWGASGPGSYDCSGLTEASWAAAGVPLARVASSQFNDGVHVPLSAAAPGDLVFWSSNGTAAGIYHVGISLGNGQMVDAAKPGTAVRVEAMWPGAYPLATRP